MTALGRLRECSAGAVAIVTAITLPVLLGFVSLGTEVGHWYLTQRQMQGAADASAISAAAQYIADFSTNPSSLTYQTVGQSYASLNGFTIPISNVCLVTSSGDNCGTVRSLDSRAIVCASPPCVVVEVTENTLSWLTTQRSLEPKAGSPWVQSIPTPTLKARAIVSAKSQTQTQTTNGTDCVLALANAADAVWVHGNGDLKANCGIAIDGGRDQNVLGTPIGRITLDGNGIAHISNLIVASSISGCSTSTCHLYNPSSSALPSSAIFTNTATPDPYASMVFPTLPLGVQTGGVVIGAKGSNYTSGTRTFTVVGGTGTPAKFTATVPTSGASKGQVTAILLVIDPGAYTVFPTSPVTAIPDTGGGSGATFTLTEGCFTWVSPPIAGRKYCSINLNGAGTTNFPTGSYYIAGGDIGAPTTGCVGFCVSSANATVTSDAAGVTFYLTNGDGANSRGVSSYASVSIASGTVSLCAPGTNCGTTCDNTIGSCLLFVQGAPAAVLASHPVPESTAQNTPSTTNNTFSGNGTRTMSGLVYLPKQTFAESGNGPILGCFGVVAKYIDVGGTPTFSNGCLPGNGIGGTITTVTTWGTPFLYQ